ncbi:MULTISPECIES: L,D-transpeptidase family protein [Rhizobium]|uniref:L,D-transpeptidase family protein n=1 Tax=Rhizobium bangladeshense TaxID=1138189 RepID=A0ABS7LM68_9HYPH|nr:MULTISPECIES: L,D-transpeptidase family protein [Rhizobium]MBX4869389.1 L,D-transpeptidase [Rhizobium bangladeshense]MBX4874783.1 L,D-transpeptidase [Rhizobium bangladeshense]MBX4885176.1 L,D-transpeptidase [Rhizobium bangladeshense]MBX4891990.1 L,D-transpeptidase [Rhizobium bangladeshense]MBX4897141.1 L,D-transpeptidase [Rhizobium bangladeshense]
MSFDRHLSRRSFLSLSAMTAASALTGCASSANTVTSGDTSIIYRSPMRLFRSPGASSVPSGPELAVMYGPVEDGGFLIPAVPYEQIDPRYYRQRVLDPTGQPPGTIVVDTPSRFLYLVQADGMAMRYGVGIGREGFAWQGSGVIQWRQKWPRWKPPNEMVARQPELVKYSIENGGMEPGLTNPLGARALYIFSNGEDTLYRLHGNPDWRSIGKAVSSGCVRLLNQDIIDLYDRVPTKAPIVVWQ